MRVIGIGAIYMVATSNTSTLLLTCTVTTMAQSAASGIMNALVNSIFKNELIPAFESLVFCVPNIEACLYYSEVPFYNHSLLYCTTLCIYPVEVWPRAMKVDNLLEPFIPMPGSAVPMRQHPTLPTQYFPTLRTGQLHHLRR